MCAVALAGAALPSIAALDKSPLRLGFQYIGSDIFGHAITAGSDFVDVVGKAITFAEGARVTARHGL